jgi:hypothetical protein
METPSTNPGRLAETSKRFARCLLAIGENRIELLMVEVQEERERLLHAIVLALGVAALGLLAGVALHWRHRGFAVGILAAGVSATIGRPLQCRGGLSLPATHAAAARLAESSRHP